MKKLLFTFAFLIFCGISFAQYQKGDWQISGGYTYDFTKSKLYDYPQSPKEDTYSYRIFAGVEYFVSDNLSVGVSPFWQESNYKLTNESWDPIPESEELGLYIENNNIYLRDLGIEMSAKYYYPIVWNFHFTLKGFFSVSTYKRKLRQSYIFYNDGYSFQTNGSFDTNKWAYTVGLTPGLSYIRPRWGLHLNFLPISYIGQNDKMSGWPAKRVEPYLYDVYNDQGEFIYTEVYFATLDENAKIKRRKNDFDVNWASFSLALSYKF